MKKIIFILFTILTFNIAYAEYKSEKVKTLMEVVGLLSMLEDQLAAGKAQGEKMGKKAVTQMLSQINPNPEVQSKFEMAFNKYIEKMRSPLTAQDIVSLWSEYYGKNFTEEELDELITFYKSPLGQKDAKVSRTAMGELTIHLQKLQESIFQKATQEYIDALKQAVKECNCVK